MVYRKFVSAQAPQPLPACCFRFLSLLLGFCFCFVLPLHAARLLLGVLAVTERWPNGWTGKKSNPFSSSTQNWRLPEQTSSIGGVLSFPRVHAPATLPANQTPPKIIMTLATNAGAQTTERVGSNFKVLQTSFARCFFAERAVVLSRTPSARFPSLFLRSCILRWEG